MSKLIKQINVKIYQLSVVIANMQGNQMYHSDV